MNNATIDLAQELIARPSVTPDDANCQEIISKRLERIGFHIEHLSFGDVKNFYARRGTAEPVLLFAGHTDVVPPGPLEKWTSPPFEPTLRDGFLFGRGAADMKSSLAAMVVACENFIDQYPNHKGSIAFLITSDEEGPSVDGTQRVVAALQERNETINYCIVGEASSEKILGDVIKVGRRGSLNGNLTILGKQGHIAYPDKTENSIHRSLAPINDLCHTTWDAGNEYFQPTSFQISNVHAGTGADNVIPGHVDAKFNFRFSTAVTAEELKARVHSILDQHHLKYTIDWRLSGLPFLSKLGELHKATSKAVLKVSGIEPRASTHGGTSDGRFIINMGCEIIELGPLNESIHQIDENINVAELKNLTRIYFEIMANLFN